jgi:hypothetical protein
VLELPIPVPPATHNVPFQAIVAHLPEINVFPDVEGVQSIPSVLVANLLAPSPPATHIVPFQAIQFPRLPANGPGYAVQLIPSGLVAIELVLVSPSPPSATHIEPFQATAFARYPANGSVVTGVQFIPSELYAIVTSVGV